MADSFQYGDYVFAFVRTVAFEDEPEFDPSNTDRIHNKYRLTIQGVIAGVASPGLPAILPPGRQGETTAEILRRIREDLMAPRQYLLYGQNGKTVIEVADPPDAANGPFPVSFHTLLVSPGSITVEFTVEVRIADCSLGRSRGWSSNRWTQTDSYDKLAYCTTKTQGVLIGRSDLNQQTVDDFRGLVTPQLRNGFQMERWSYTISPDGLRLAYEFEDVEYYLPPPLGALEWSGEFQVMVANNVWFGICSVTIKGAKAADKAFLWQMANLIALARLRPLVPQGDAIPITQMGFTENLNAAEISVNFRIMLDPNQVAKAAGQLPGKGGKVTLFGADLIGTPLPGLPFKNQPAIGPAIRGNHPLVRLVTSVFRDPCHLTAELSTSGPLVSPGEANSGPIGNRNPGRRELGNQAEITVGEVPTPSPISPGSQFRPAVYQRYAVRTNYLWHGNTTSLVPTDADKKRAFVDLGPQTLDLVVEWVVERTGQMPELPDPCPPSDACELYKLLDQAVLIEDPAIGPTGELVHKAYGRYVYGCTDPSRVNLAEPLPPFLVGFVKEQKPYTYLKDPVWKFLTVPASLYWKRCCEAATAKPKLNPELNGGGVIGGIIGGVNGGIPPGWLPGKDIALPGTLGGIIGGTLQGGGVVFPGG